MACDTQCICGSKDFEQGLVFLENNQQLSNKQRRFKAYKDASVVLSYGPRQKLPSCVESAIKARFPDADAVYVGYKEKK